MLLPLPQPTNVSIKCNNNNNCEVSDSDSDEDALASTGFVTVYQNQSSLTSSTTLPSGLAAITPQGLPLPSETATHSHTLVLAVVSVNY